MSWSRKSKTDGRGQGKSSASVADEQNSTQQMLSDMFRGAVEPDVIALVLTECNWNGEFFKAEMLLPEWTNHVAPLFGKLLYLVII